MKVIKSKRMPRDMVMLLRGEIFLWYGKLSAPWDDVDCDTAIVSQEDFSLLLAKLRVNIEQKGLP